MSQRQALRVDRLVVGFSRQKACPPLLPVGFLCFVLPFEDMSSSSRLSALATMPADYCHACWRTGPLFYSNCKPK